MYPLEQYFTQHGASSFILVSDNARASPPFINYSRHRGRPCRSPGFASSTLPASGNRHPSSLSQNPPLHGSTRDKGSSRWDPSPSPQEDGLHRPAFNASSTSPIGHDSVLVVPLRTKEEVNDDHFPIKWCQQRAEVVATTSCSLPVLNDSIGRRKGNGLSYPLGTTGPATRSSTRHERLATTLPAQLSSRTIVPGRGAFRSTALDHHTIPIISYERRALTGTSS